MQAVGLSSGRTSTPAPPHGFNRIPPDLAFEVVGPKDEAAEIDDRLEDYLRAGVRLVWVIYPSTRHLMIFRQGPDCTRLSDADTLDGEDVLPGFGCKIADLFPKPKS